MTRALLLVCALLCASTVAGAGQFLVGLDGPQSTAQAGVTVENFKQGTGLEITLVRMIGDRVLLVTTPTEDPSRFVEVLSSQSGVEYVEPDRRVRPRFVPVDPRYSSQWYLFEDTAGLRMQSAWDHERGDADIVIAQLDTGIIDHGDIDSARVLRGFDFISDAGDANDGNGRDNDPTDPGDATLANECGVGDPASDTPSSWHGLHLAGIMIATADNQLGGAGINHRSRLLPVRVLGKCGGLLSDTVDAMRWSAGFSVSGVSQNTSPARVLNLSFGGEGPCSRFEQNAINEIVSTGAVIVVSAGNESKGLSGPALCENVVVVAAVSRSGARASYSNFGGGVTISVPGGDGNFEGIFSTWNSGEDNAGSDAFKLFQGTSVAAAQVSGVVSLMLSANPDLAPSQIKTLLQDTAREFPDSSCNESLCGAGLVDANAAVVAAAGTTAIAVAPPPASASGDEGGGSSGGGCTVSSAGHARDPLLPAVVFLALLGIYRCNMRRQVKGSRTRLSPRTLC